jgi:hypothetical protein
MNAHPNLPYKKKPAGGALTLYQFRNLCGWKRPNLAREHHA